MDKEKKKQKASKQNKKIDRLDALFSSKKKEKKKEKNKSSASNKTAALTPKSEETQVKEKEVTASEVDQSDVNIERMKTNAVQEKQKQIENSVLPEKVTNEDAGKRTSKLLEQKNSEKSQSKSHVELDRSSLSISPLSFSADLSLSPDFSSLSPLSPLPPSNKSKKVTRNINTIFPILTNEMLYRKLPDPLKLEANNLKQMHASEYIAELVTRGPQGINGVDITLKNKFNKKTILFSEKMKKSVQQKVYTRIAQNHKAENSKHLLSSSESHHSNQYSLLKNEIQPIFDHYKFLYASWRQYFTQVLSMPEFNFNKADYHGCFMKVSSSGVPCEIGIKGIVLEETNNSFLLLTRENQLHRIFKIGRQFQFQIDSKLYTIIGSSFVHRR